MMKNIKNFLNSTGNYMEIIYRVVKGIDYKTLNQYILNINQLQDVDSILYVLSRCLKEILDYDLFGFALKDGDESDIWIDPRIYNASLINTIQKDLNCHESEINTHYFEKEFTGSMQKDVTFQIEELLSYKVLDSEYTARLYVLPKRKMLYYHTEILNILIKTTAITLEKTIEIKKLENAATIDPLTNSYNRRALSSFMEHDTANVKRYGKNLSVIMFDIDHFKKVNDTYGHQAGDKVLKEIAQKVHSTIRQGDYLARYGGEEFVIVLPDTKLTSAVELAERLRVKISKQRIKLDDSTINVTSSFGVAEYNERMDGDMLLMKADENLYKAKTSGRNNVKPAPEHISQFITEIFHTSPATLSQVQPTGMA